MGQGAATGGSSDDEGDGKEGVRQAGEEEAGEAQVEEAAQLPSLDFLEESNDSVESEDKSESSQSEDKSASTLDEEDSNRDDSCRAAGVERAFNQLAEAARATKSQGSYDARALGQGSYHAATAVSAASHAARPCSPPSPAAYASPSPAAYASPPDSEKRRSRHVGSCALAILFLCVYTLAASLLMHALAYAHRAS